MGGLRRADVGDVARRLNVAAPQPIARSTSHSDAVTVPGLGLLSVSGFEDPVWLYVLAAPVALLAVYLTAQRRRRRRMRRFVGAAVPSRSPNRAETCAFRATAP